MTEPTVSILDVGHGNCAVLIDDKVVVIDAGPGTTLLDFLEKEGIKEVGVVLISHADEENREPVAVVSHSFWQRRFAGAVHGALELHCPEHHLGMADVILVDRNWPVRAVDGLKLPPRLAGRLRAGRTLAQKENIRGDFRSGVGLEPLCEVAAGRFDRW